MSKFSVVHSPSLFRSMLFLAAPVIAEESLMLMVGWTDWWLAGHYLDGKSPLAAMSLLVYVMWLIPSLFAAISIGSTAMVARFVGAGDMQQANHCANQAIMLGAIFAVVVTGFISCFYQQFISLMNLPGDAAGYSLTYLQIIIWVIPMIMIEQVGAACLRGAGDTVTGLVAKTAVNIVNIVVSAGLVTGWSIFPNVGFVGLAIGTAAGHTVGGTIILLAMVAGRAGIKLQLSEMKPNWNIVSRLLKIGLPGGFDILLLVSCQLIFIRMVYQLGEAAAAAHGLAIQVEALAYLPGSAFQVAAATMSGQFLGAKDARRAVRSVAICCGSCLTVMGSAAIVLFFFGGEITSFFTSAKEQETAQLSGELLKIIALAVPSLAIVMVMSGTLRGAGDTRFALAITATGFLCIRIPMTYFFIAEAHDFSFAASPWFGFGFGIYGAWYAMATDLIIRSFLMLGRFFQGGWMKIKI